MKKCSRCQQIKSETEFYRRSDSADGYTYECRSCENKKARARYAREKAAQAEVEQLPIDDIRSKWWSKRTWKIVEDPDNSWSPNSFLSDDEIKRLRKKAYFTPGTVLKNSENGAVLEIK